MSESNSAYDKKTKLDQLLTEPWETKETGVDVQLPFPKMKQPIPNGERKQAGSFSTPQHTSRIAH
jgi:hypothetical protein